MDELDIHIRKIHFVQEFLNLTDEAVIERFEKALRSEQQKAHEDALQPMSMKDFNEMINQAEEDSKNGSLISAQDIKKEIDSWT